LYSRPRKIKEKKSLEKGEKGVSEKPSQNFPLNKKKTALQIGKGQEGRRAERDRKIEGGEKYSVLPFREKFREHIELRKNYKGIRTRGAGESELNSADAFFKGSWKRSGNQQGFKKEGQRTPSKKRKKNTRFRIRKTWPPRRGNQGQKKKTK